MRRLQNVMAMGVVSIAGMLMMGSVHAVPSFATKYEKNCSYCHNAWPQLNAKGRKFKEQGYRFKEDLKAEANTTPYYEAGDFPISGMFISRPYDNKDSGERQIRAIHEVELFIAGTMGNKISIFTEIEAEDETDFAPEFGSTALSYRFSKEATLQMTYTQANWADGYGFLGGHFRLTRGHVAVIDQAFGGVDGSLRSKRQNVALTGRVAGDKLFYNVSIGGIAGDAEGEEDTSINARVAFDIKKNIMVGGYILSGEAASMDFNRTIIDAQADLEDIRIQAAFAMAEDDTTAGTDKNNAFSLQAYNTMKTKKGMPTWVQLVRFDSYERSYGDSENDGEYRSLTLNLTHYLAQNVKAYVEYWDLFDTPAGVDKDNRLTLQLYVGL
ncbi:MAG: hypothetical protein COB30_014375 [Ectothiorhodospiraceae bacterium]|nr:hypothetical protein [Ectothiorhodospiraceae bacterium]